MTRRSLSAFLRLLTPVVLVGVCILSGIGGRTALATPAQMHIPPAPMNSSPACSGDSCASAQQVSQIVKLVNADPDDFAGVAADATGNGMGVYVVAHRAQQPSTQGALAHIQQLLSVSSPAAGRTRTAPRWRLHFASATHSLHDLQTIMSEVHTKQPWADLSKPYLAEWGPDVRTNTVVVGLTAISPALQAEAQRAFGSVVRLQLTTRAHPVADRWTDISPFWGGDALWSGNSTQGWRGCTAGFPVTDQWANPGFLTAGHCFDYNTTIKQGNWSPILNGQPPSTGSTFGLVTARVNGLATRGTDGTDAEFVAARALPGSTNQVQARVWTTHAGSSLNISGSLSTWVGAFVCTDGVRTDQNCSGVVEDGPNCLTTDNGFTYCNEWRIQSTNGSVMFQEGDSGGPVYQGDGNGGVRAMGLISLASPASGNYYYADINIIGEQLNISMMFNGQTL